MDKLGLKVGKFGLKTDKFEPNMRPKVTFMDSTVCHRILKENEKIANILQGPSPFHENIHCRCGFPP